MYVCMSLSLMKKKKKELGVGAVTRSCLFVCFFGSVGMGSVSFCREGWMRVCFVFCILYFVFCGKIQMKMVMVMR